MQFTDLTDPDREVLQAAIAASDWLYLQDIQEVGAALRTTSGVIYTAIHFETSTGWANVCGEVAAICCMVATGHRDLEIIAAVWRAPDDAHDLLPPCGRCREVISDFNPHARVIVSRSSDHWDAEAIHNPCVVRVSDLLPLKSHSLGESA